MDNYISARSFADKVKKSPTTISKWCREGRIPGAYLIDGITWRIPKDTKLSDIDIPKMGRPVENGNGQKVKEG